MATNRATRYPGRWGAVSADYRMGEPKNRTSDTAKDGSYFEKDWIADYEAYFGAVLDEAGQTVNGTTDTAQNSQLHKAMQLARQVEPLNGSYNGFMDPEHQSNLPAPNGYPGNSGGGEASYDTDDEISFGIFSATDSNSVSSDSDGWIFTGAIYKQETLTAAQMALFNEDTLPVFVKDQDGNAYSLKNGDTGVTVSIVGATATITISSDIFTGSFTKLWRFFVTEKVGYVGELSADESERRIRGGFVKITSGNSYAHLYPNGYAEQFIVGSQPSGSADTQSANLVLELVSNDPTQARASITGNTILSSAAAATLNAEVFVDSTTTVQYKLLSVKPTTIEAVTGNKAAFITVYGKVVI